MTNRIGNVIRAKRVLRGYSQEELAEKIGKSTGYIGQIERGETNPSAQTLARFIEVLGIDANTLFYDESQTPYISNEIAIRASRLDAKRQDFILGVIDLMERTIGKDIDDDNSCLR